VKLSGAGHGHRRRRDAHPKGTMVRVGLGRLSIHLTSANCEDGVIRQYQPAHIRVRIEVIGPLAGVVIL